MNPDRLAELDEERSFLLRSLADLEREHDAGDVDDVDYEALKDCYTARAAEVLRSIDEGRARQPRRRPINHRRLIVAIAATVVAAGLAGWLLTRNASPRAAGDTITGGGVVGVPTGTDPASLLARARAALNSDPLTAIKLYDRILESEPTNVEALTYRGWSAVFTAFNVPEGESRNILIGSAVKFLDKARATDPTYVDAQCFTAIVRFRFQNDAAGAKGPYGICTAAKDLPDSVAGVVQALGSQIDEALAQPATSVGESIEPAATAPSEPTSISTSTSPPGSTSAAPPPT